MCITGSVGRGGVNRVHDVKTVQILLNLNSYQLRPLDPLAESGACGPLTIAAIEWFQRRVRGAVRPDAIARRAAAGEPARHGLDRGRANAAPSALSRGRSVIQPLTLRQK